MQLKVAGGLVAQTLSISQNLVSTWHGAPSQVNQNSELVYLNSPLKQENFATFPKIQDTKILTQHSQRLIPAQVNQY